MKSGTIQRGKAVVPQGSERADSLSGPPGDSHGVIDYTAEQKDLIFEGSARGPGGEVLICAVVRTRCQAEEGLIVPSRRRLRRVVAEVNNTSRRTLMETVPVCPPLHAPPGLKHTLQRLFCWLAIALATVPLFRHRSGPPWQDGCSPHNPWHSRLRCAIKYRYMRHSIRVTLDRSTQLMHSALLRRADQFPQ